MITELFLSVPINTFQFPYLISEQSGGFKVENFHCFVHLGFLSSDELFLVLAEDFLVEREIGSNGAIMFALDLVGDIMNFFAHRLRSDAVRFVVRDLNIAATVRLINRALQ